MNRLPLLSTLFVVLAACAPAPSPPTATPTVTVTPLPTATATIEPAPTFTVTPTPIPLVPTGFQVGPLLPDPKTGQNTLELNRELTPEQWGDLRENIIEAIYKGSRAWGKFTGEANDATSMSYDVFLEKALAGEIMDVPLPTRLTGLNASEIDAKKSNIVDVDNFNKGKYRKLQFIDVGGIKLDNPKLEILSPDLATDKQRQSETNFFVPTLSEKESDGVLFSIDPDHNVVISVGRFSFNRVTGNFPIGVMDADGNFRVDETDASDASIILGLTLDELSSLEFTSNRSSDPYFVYVTYSGDKFYTINIAKVFPGLPLPGEYPSIFVSK